MILVSFMDQKFARWTRGDDGANFLIHDIRAAIPRVFTNPAEHQLCSK